MRDPEFAVATVYRAHPEMTDHAGLRVYGVLAALYTAEMAGRANRAAYSPALS